MVVGLGPAGLFAAYVLAKHGYRPLVLERGGDLDERDKVVDAFWKGGALDTDCNIQFGEGGAGAYSDGKLTTRIGDPLCDNVLEIPLPRTALRRISSKKAKPHVGTDILKNVVREMRREIIKNGGEVRFRTPLTGVSVKNGALCAVQADGRTSPASGRCWPSVTGARHLAALHGNGVYFEPKAFSVGVRIEHLQTEIDRALYGKAAGHPAAACGVQSRAEPTDARVLFLLHVPGRRGRCGTERGEHGRHQRHELSCARRQNANAALAVSVDPKDYDDGTPFGGVALQRRIEHAAYTQTGSYRAPCQKVGDFLNGKPTRKTRCGQAQLSHRRGAGRGGSLPARLRADHAAGQPAVFRPEDSRLRHSGRVADRSGNADLVSGAHTTRGEDLFGLGCSGIIPCGEGAGYAGGIMSAAVDGIARRFGLWESLQIEN